jgi:hypothetical protein
MIGEIQPPLDLIKRRPQVVPIRFPFDIIEADFTQETKKGINKLINDIGNLGSQDLESFIDKLSELNEGFLNKIPTKDYNLLPAGFNFEDQFTNLKEGDIIVFESYYDYYGDVYRGPMYFVIGNYGQLNVRNKGKLDGKDIRIIRFYRAGDEPDDSYTLPSEAAPIVTKNEGTTLAGIRTLYPEVDIETINLSKNLNLKDENGKKISGTYYFGSSEEGKSTIVTIDDNILYLGNKYDKNNYFK